MLTAAKIVSKVMFINVKEHFRKQDGEIMIYNCISTRQNKEKPIQRRKKTKKIRAQINKT